MSDSNPFATRFCRPGAIGFLFADGESIDSLIATLRENRWWGEIVGPHGSGKSTLVATLIPALEAAGRTVVRFSVSPRGERDVAETGQPSLDSLLADANRWTSTTQLILDGYEQLSWWTRWKITSLCHRRHAGLLVTAHHSMGLPPLFQTEPSELLAQRLASSLLPPGDTSISPADVTAAYQRAGGNLRETLFALYDLHQSRRPPTSGASD